MYIEQAYKGSTEIWKYILGIVTIAIGWQLVGSLPLLLALFVKSAKSGSFPVDVPGMVTLLGSNLFLLLLIVSFLAGLLTLLFWNKFVHQSSLKELTTTRKKIDYSRIGFGFFLVLVLNLITFGLDYYNSPDNYQWNFEPEKFLILALITIPLLPIQTSFEEYFMRGYLMQGIGIAAKNRWLPLFLTSMLFGLMHMFNPEVEKLGYVVMVYYIGTGFLLGIMTLMDDGLELALGFHAGNNVLTALLVTSDWTALQTNSIFLDVSEPEIGFEIIFPLAFYAVILFIMAKKYKWTNWKDKLFGKVVKNQE